ncbi:hypothetical protein M434DRAFT_30579 [Hypoxylon sp. CO27-5]|nr:hypothetical protein M434DRAFT_30579 [Hypoxylon sp. CO27-5]
MVTLQPYTSTFGYGLTRKYPFRWFTPVVIIGGLIATVLISLANLGSSGYVLLVETTNDPNATISQKELSWGASGLTKTIHPTCQPATIEQSSVVRTNCSLFSYDVQVVKNNAANYISASLVYDNE